MKSPTNRIALILTVIFLIPALFFSVYEISSLTKDEEMMASIYEKQLETILFSVNQYSDDILSTWISKTEAAIDNSNSGDPMPPGLQSLLELNSPMTSIFVINQDLVGTSLKTYSLGARLDDSLNYSILEQLTQNKELIQQLIKYKKSGFQKTELLGSGELSIHQTLVFVMGREQNDFMIAGFIIEPEMFVEDLVGPRLQSVSRDQFTLSVFNKSNNSNIYSTILGDTATLASVALTKDFWIFPNYTLGIRTQGATLDELIRKRTTDNLYLLLGLDIVLIVALLWAFRNVKREVQLAQNKSDFVSNVSHEIRTPLALISMFAETLEMGRIKDEKKKEEYYRIISKETLRLTGIVNKILNFSQTEAGKKSLRIDRVNLIEPIEDLLTTYDFHLKNKGFEYEFRPQNEPWVLADKEALVEIVINLIDNAIKYSVDTKKIQISVGVDNGQGWVAVKDWGAGISVSDQKHIFDKFYRVSTGNLAKSQGTGLGLSFVKQLIEQQNGKISVTSQLGSGSTFTIYYPLAE